MTFFPKGLVKALRAEGTVGEAESQREQPVLKRFILEEQGHIEWPTEMHPSCFGWYMVGMLLLVPKECFKSLRAVETEGGAEYRMVQPGFKKGLILVEHCKKSVV